MSGEHHDLGDLAYPDLQRLLTADARKVAIVPLGSTEAHGPHLPLATDSLISIEVAEIAAAALADRGYVAVRFPPIHYGVTDWAASFSGTVSLSSELTHRMILETCLAAKAIGFCRVVITNAHLEPGHIQTLREVTKAYEAETGEPLVFPDKTRRKNAARLTEEFQSGSCHAGQYETSLVMAIAPRLVKREVAAGLPRHHVPLHERIRDGAKDFVDCGLDQAYCGDPAGATDAEGYRSLQALADMVVEAVQVSFAEKP